MAGGIQGGMKESIQRSFAYLQSHKTEMGISALFDSSDFHVEAIDLLGNRIPCDAGIAFIIALFSAIKKQSSLPAMLILGDMSIQGILNPYRVYPKYCKPQWIMVLKGH